MKVFWDTNNPNEHITIELNPRVIYEKYAFGKSINHVTESTSQKYWHFISILKEDKVRRSLQTG